MPHKTMIRVDNKAKVELQAVTKVACSKVDNKVVNTAQLPVDMPQVVTRAQTQVDNKVEPKVVVRLLMTKEG